MSQYFQQSDYDAFIQPKPSEDTDSVRKERLAVKSKLQALHAQLLPYIKTKGWDLHAHRMAQHNVSSHFFITLPDGTQIVNYIESMWLHFGKSAQQLDYYKCIGGYDWKKYDDDNFYNAFYLHTRIQFYINATAVRAWLLIATDKNYYDRSEFLKDLRSGKRKISDFCSLLMPLKNHSYFYEIAGNRFDLSVPFNQEDLYNFIKTDRHGIYSGIVKEYDPSDPAISQENIVAEFKNCLDVLYPIYDFVAYRP